jgi:hypothetical protein
MLNFKKTNNITGWLVFAVSTLAYALTVEPTASFWDVGEFIATSYKLEVPHPPGAPFFLLIGRMFSFLALGDVTQVAYWVNMSAVICSGFTILFLFWSITLLGRKIFKAKLGEETTYQTLMIMGAGVVGALAYTFSDSFWFSAVEAEVYAMSSFFTAFVFWAILKWELIEDSSRANKWLILIAYMIGLSIGVHLLNLVTMPALGLIYYFKKYPKPTTKGIIYTLIISGAIIILIMSGIIPGLPLLAGKMEIFFVNTLGLPFGSGIIFFAIVFLSALIWAIQYSIKSHKVMLNTFLMGLTFILIGYSSYTIILIRANYNPPINQNHPSNVMSFVFYLLREQYVAPPLFSGQYFTAKLIDQKQGAPVYAKGEDRYEIVDHKIENVYDPKHNTLFPRTYSNQPHHKEKYQKLLGLAPGQKPNFRDNLYFFLSHQLNHMYLRYFLWNFVGKQSDFTDSGWLNPFKTEKDIPYILEKNKARNNFLMLPLLLGLVGMLFHYKRDIKNFSVVAILFFLTGIALIIYLNSPPAEPRERDYIYVGSFYAFAFWIGYGVIAMGEVFSKIWKHRIMAPAIATTIGLIVPGIMAAEGWDDHDRSDRYFSVDSAKNFLASCAPNAILFTGGDNDTYPLWYVQEVEGFRTDVRVIVLTYLNTDWYIDQMKRPAYESNPLPFSLEREHYRQGGPNDYIPYVEAANIRAIDIRQYVQLIRQNHPALQVATSFGKYNSLPSKNMYIDVNTEEVLAKGIIPENLQHLLTNRMNWTLKGNALHKNDLMIIDLIASNNWERPIYFNTTSLQNTNLNLRDYVVEEGTTYRLLPVENPNKKGDLLVNTRIMYSNLMNNFHWRGLDNPRIYYSKEYRDFVLNHRSSFNSLAEAMIIEDNIAKAKEVLYRSLELMPDHTFLYDFESANTAGLLLQIGEKDKAIEIAQTIMQRADEWLEYMIQNKLPYESEIQRNLLALQLLSFGFKNAQEDELTTQAQNILIKHYSRIKKR